MSKQRRIRDATKCTSKTGEDRPGARPEQAEAESRTPAPASSKEADPIADETAGRSTDEYKKEVVESTTKAAAIVKPKVKVGPPTCPRCHERRYSQELKGKRVKCTNCRTMQVLK